MSIFSRIKDAIWGRSDQAVAPEGIDTRAKPISASASAVPGSAPVSRPAAVAVSEVNVAAILDEAVQKKRQKLNWRKSIVDLMKALDLDSSLSSRRELARELGYDGDTKNSAKMNIWLHRQVIQKLKENGGKIPADLL